jgi:hypothetical protein
MGDSDTGMMRNPYRLLGMGLCLGGAAFAPVAYLILESVPLTAIALSTIVIGIICIALANTRPYISPEACQILLKTGMENTAALLEELGLRNKALYLPSAMRDGYPQAIIPLEDGDIKLIQGKIPGRLIVRYGAAPDDMAIAVTTPGSMSIELLKSPPGPTAEDIESAASFILTGMLDLADSVTVSSSDSRVDVLVRGARLRYEDVWCYRCLGSPIASIAAAICSEALNKPVRIKEENHSRRESRIIIEVLP